MIKIRKAEANDIFSIVKILDESSGDKKDIIPEQFLIAGLEGNLLGCVRIVKTSETFKLASLVVIPNYRNKGIGSNLLQTILNKNPLYRPLYLFCNIKNKDFYERFGFCIINQEKLPKNLQEEYKELLNKKFSGNDKILIAMFLL